MNQEQNTTVTDFNEHDAENFGKLKGDLSANGPLRNVVSFESSCLFTLALSRS